MDLPAPVSPVSAVRPDLKLELRLIDENQVAELKVGEHAGYSASRPSL